MLQIIFKYPMFDNNITTDDVIKYIRDCCIKYAATSLDSVKQVISHYGAISTISGIEFITFPQILYFDIENISEYNKNIDYDLLMQEYNNLINTYGNELINLIITKDNDVIITRINEIVNFLMDTVYHTNIALVMFDNDNINHSLYSSLINSSLMNNFDVNNIISPSTIKSNNDFKKIIIKKRGNENVNNAN